MSISSQVPAPTTELNPIELARTCAYDHVSRLISALADQSLAAQVDLGERTFYELERVE